MYAALGAASGRGAAAAVLVGPSGPRTVRLGEVVDGWRLAGVSRTALTFERDGVRQVLTVGAPAAAQPTDSTESPSAQ